jgi:hypothetical protein
MGREMEKGREGVRDREIGREREGKLMFVVRDGDGGSYEKELIGRKTMCKNNCVCVFV